MLHGLRVLYLQRAELLRAYEMGEQCLTLAQRQRDPALLEAAHQGLGTVLFWRGEFAQARTHMEAGLLSMRRSATARQTCSMVMILA